MIVIGFPSVSADHDLRCCVVRGCHACCSHGCGTEWYFPIWGTSDDTSLRLARIGRQKRAERVAADDNIAKMMWDANGDALKP